MIHLQFLQHWSRTKQICSSCRERPKWLGNLLWPKVSSPIQELQVGKVPLHCCFFPAVPISIEQFSRAKQDVVDRCGGVEDSQRHLHELMEKLAR